MTATLEHRAVLRHRQVMAAAMAARSRAVSLYWATAGLMVGLLAAVWADHLVSFWFGQQLPFAWMFALGPYLPTIVPALFAFIVVAPWEKIYLYGALGIPAIVYAVLYVAYSIWMDRRGGDNVNHSAHLWGAAFGVLAVLVAVPGAPAHFLRVLANPGG